MNLCGGGDGGQYHYKAGEGVSPQCRNSFVCSPFVGKTQSCQILLRVRICLPDPTSNELLILTNFQLLLRKLFSQGFKETFISFRQMTEHASQNRFHKFRNWT